MPDKGKRTVVVTGGSRGIGRAICLALGGPDTHVFFNYVAREDAAVETEQLVAAAGGTVTGIRADVASAEDVNTFFNNITKETGRIDVLVNNAGISRDGLLVRMKDADWDAVLDINLRAAFLCAKNATKAMMKQRYGRVVFMTSVVGIIGNPGQANYAASKAGLIGLAKSMARELASRGITVNAVAPGLIETDMTASLPDKAKEAMVAQIPLGRAGKPEDIAAVVAFLVSDQASYITGQVIHVSGGMYI
jgi:3-oxoacyl-[acyl-carrier protein] reductase